MIIKSDLLVLSGAERIESLSNLKKLAELNRMPTLQHTNRLDSLQSAQLFLKNCSLLFLCGFFVICIDLIKWNPANIHQLLKFFSGIQKMASITSRTSCCQWLMKCMVMKRLNELFKFFITAYSLWKIISVVDNMSIFVNFNV